MFSEAVRQEIECSHNIFEPIASAVWRKWAEFPVSRMSHHGQACCETVREWLLALDFALLKGDSPQTGPRWILQKFKWGPTHWQLFWCDAVKQKTLDCGALAALANEIFNARGVRSFPVQLVQQYDHSATNHWQYRWREAESSTHWLDGEMVYHEGCAVLPDANEIKIWDASAGCWLNSPRRTNGYGGVVALRLFADSPQPLNWETHRIIPNVWQEIGGEVLEVENELAF